MFELGAQLAKQYGPENVFDFSLGNPALEPPAAFQEALRKYTSPDLTGVHAYTPNRGLLPCLTACAARVSRMHGGVPMPQENLCMTVGAAGAMNVFLHATAEPGDEVVAFSPYFLEYSAYAENAGCTLREIPVDPKTFFPDAAALEKVISEKTRAIILNSPNNPTGTVYSQESIEAVARVAKAATEKYGRPVWIVGDEPYANIIYDGKTNCNILGTEHLYNVIITSFSKDLSIPGERIGYIAVDSRVGEGRDLLMAAITLYNRTLGFVNCPSLFQRAVAESCDANIDVSWYDARRKALCTGLKAAGLEINVPEGAFYAFPKVPEGVDEKAFVDALAKRCVLVVPGSAFHLAGYIRMSYAVKSVEMIERACKIIAEVVKELKA